MGKRPPFERSDLAATIALLLCRARITATTIRFPRWSFAALAFAPLLWPATASTMDYAWSLLFILLSLEAAHRKKLIPGGICLGIAAGFRPSNAVALLPLLAFVYYTQERTAKGLAIFCLAAALSAAAAFAPVIQNGPLQHAGGAKVDHHDRNGPGVPGGEQQGRAGYCAVLEGPQRGCAGEL